MALDETQAFASTVDPIQIRPGDGRRLRVITDLVTIKATSDDTAGVCTLYEAETPPAGGWPPHVRRHDDETLYVLAGRYAVLVGDEVFELGPGGFAFVPRGTVRAFTNVGATPARMLVLVTPGGIQEQLFGELGDRADRAPWEPDMARVLAVAPKYGVEFLTPTETVASTR